ncbi:MAG: alpha/beta fold hydrolase [Oscillospiraceae bacterium]|nr:alpha/beta fold hydrolase [Oscillospiraceae bacterium]
MNWKKPLSLALAAALSASLAVPAFAAEETAAPWYAEAQAYVTEKGIMTGTENGFEPEAEITTATVLQALYNKVGKPDVTKSNDPWYIRALTWAEEEGIFQPEGETPFADGPVSRALTLDILTAFCAKNGLASDGLMQGNENGDMMADKVLTRAEFATVLMRLDQLTPYFKETVVAIEAAEADSIPAHTIPGTLCAPAEVEGKKLPAVVMLHGTGSNREEAGNGYQMAAPVMADNGIVTLRIDFMGSGDSTADYSDYCYSSANLDAKAAADYLATLDYVDADKIAVMGWSQGGTNALLAAAAYPETFHAVITWAGALTLNESTGLFGDKTFDEAKAIADKDGSYEMTFDWRDSLQVGKRWFKEVDETDVEAETAKIKAPILAINGLADTTVDPENARKIVAASKNEATKLYLIENCDHTYNVFSGDFTALYETVNAGIGFLQENLNGKVGPTSAAAISKYGNVGTSLSMDILAGAGYEVGDILTVEITGQEPITLPLGTGYSNVDQGSPLALADTSNNTLALAINRGDFATTYGLGAKGEDGVYAITDNVTITVSMAEKGGYLAEMEIRELDSKRTNAREDYASDDVFANFRAITLGDIAEGRLYRTSSPVNPELGRNAYADGFLKEAGVKTVVNLADSQEAMEGYEGYAESYYATLNVVPLNMGVDMYSDDAKASLKAGFQFMIANEGPYAFHCTEGKDRAGYFAMVLEALMGAGVEEITEDYMLSFENYYHVEKGSEQWTKIAESNIEKDLLKLTGAEDADALAKADLQKAAETYLTETIGLTAAEVTALKDALSK